MTMDVEQYVRDNLLADFAGSVLCISWTLPSVLARHEGPLTYIGLNSFPGLIASSDYKARIRRGDAQLLSALEQEAEVSNRRYDLVYIDAQHGIEMLIRQVNAATRLCTPAALFVLPGGAPPERGMGTSSPTQDWWVGDVWTLGVSLEASGAKVVTSAMPPTGVIVASGVSPLDPEETRHTTARLQTEIADDVAFQRFFSHASLAEMVAMPTSMWGSRFTESVRIILDPLQPDLAKSALIDAPRDWSRPPPYFICDLSGKNLETQQLWQCRRQVHGVRVDEFHDVILLGRDVVLVGSPASDCLNTYVKNWEMGPASGWLGMIAHETESAVDTVTSIYDDNGRLFVKRSLLTSAKQLREAVFLGTPDEFLNYGMWLLYSVPSVPLYKKMKLDFPRYMAYVDRPWQRQMLLDLGLSSDELLEQKSEVVYAAPELAIMRQSHRSLSLSASDLQAFDELAVRASAMGRPGPERIFISRFSRTKAGAYRGLINEGELIERLRPLGFTIVEPELYPVLAQAKMFRDAKVVVGLGGAGMFNVAFCGPGTKVIDIESGVDWIDAHAELFASTGIDYGFILGATDETDPRLHQKNQKRWHLDVDRAISAILQHT